MIKNPFYRKTIGTKLLVSALLTFVLPELAAARAIESEISDLGTHIENVAKPGTMNDAGKSEFIAAPIPLINPTVGTGLAAVGAYLFTVDAGSQSSFIGMGVDIRTMDLGHSGPRNRFTSDRIVTSSM